MDYLGYMAPVAFIFALAAISQVNSLKKEVQQLKEELEKIKK